MLLQGQRIRNIFVKNNTILLFPDALMNIVLTFFSMELFAFFLQFLFFYNLPNDWHKTFFSEVKCGYSIKLLAIDEALEGNEQIFKIEICFTLSTVLGKSWDLFEFEFLRN